MHISSIIEESDIPAVFNPDGTITVAVLTPGVMDGVAINPGSVSITNVVRRPVLTIGQKGPKVGLIRKLWEGENGELFGKIQIEDTEIGRRVARLFRVGLLWCVQALVVVKEAAETTAKQREDYGFPDDCIMVATSASLDAITLDPFAPY